MKEIIKQGKSPVTGKKRMKKTPEYKEILKKRTILKCSCKRTISMRRERGLYGTCRCDSYSLDYHLGTIMANGLFQYIADAKMAIMRDDWDLLEKHANAIKKYSIGDSWDGLSDDRDKRNEWAETERNWREAMHWLTENWQGLWW